MSLLPEVERLHLAELEQVIDDGVRTFVAVGTALATIRDARLYRAEHDNFETYCAQRWNLSRPRAYQLMEAAEVARVSTNGGHDIDNERQARALAAAAPDDRADVMATVAAKGKPTAAAIADEIKARRPEPAPPEPEHDVCGDCGAIDPPGISGGTCQDCWEASEVQDKAPAVAPSPAPPTPLAAPPKPPTLNDTPEVQEVERLWRPAKQMGKAMRDFPSAEEVTRTLPPDSVEIFDELADDVIAWAGRWKQARKAAAGLRLVGGAL